MNAFDLREPVLAEMAVMPPDGQVVLAAGMLASSQPVFHDLAVPVLLHPEPLVRTRLPELCSAPACLGNLSPVGLRRLIGLRNWLPVDERQMPAPRPIEVTWYPSGAGSGKENPDWEAS